MKLFHVVVLTGSKWNFNEHSKKAINDGLNKGHVNQRYIYQKWQIQGFDGIIDFAILRLLPSDNQRDWEDRIVDITVEKNEW